jgi:glycosyltransferase involved in cell wall biosynthesis
MAKIAYIVSRFPKLTETFVLDEVLAMDALGLEPEVYALLRGRERVVQPAARAVLGRAHYAPVLSPGVLAAQWHFLRRRPGAYAAALWEALRGTVRSANYFIGAAGTFPKVASFARDIERRGATHVHAQFANHPALAALVVHRLTGIPFSFTARGSDIHVDRTMLRRKLEAASFAITVSEYNRDLMVRECGSHVRDKIHVLYGGIDTARFAPPGAARAGDGGPLRIVCVARFEEVKGHATLVEACRILRDRGVAFECRMIGDGPLEQATRERCAASGLDGAVRFDGALAHEDVARRVAASDVAVLATVPSRSGKREGIPNVLKEAMACELPVVASASGGIPELVEDGVSGFLLPPGDAAALAAALERLAADPALRRRLGRGGRARILADFDLRRSAARRAELFSGILVPGTNFDP